MEGKRPTITIYLETREPKKDETYPVKIRVNWKRQRKYFAIDKTRIEKLLKEKMCAEFSYEGAGDYSIKEEYFKKAIATKPRGKYANLKEVFDQLVEDAKEKANQLEYFNFESFAALMTEQPTTSTDVFRTFESYINGLRDEGRIRTAVSYNCTFTSLKKHVGKESLSFEAITIEFLKSYQKWMIEDNGNSKTTVGIYMRQLRAIFNQRPAELNNLPNPFGKNKFAIPKSTGHKVALQLDELKKLFEYKPSPGSLSERVLDFWKLQYLCNGINLTDLISLRYSNVKSDFLVFERHKTARTSNNPQNIKIPITPEIKAILNKYSNEKKSDKTYIFPFLKDTMSPEKKDKLLMNLSSEITHKMKRIALQAGIDQQTSDKICSYASRHSFATTLMKKGASVAYISKQLGHSSIETTANYLASFEDKHLQEWQSKLTDF